MNQRFLLAFALLILLGAKAGYSADRFSRADGTWSATLGGPDCGCVPGQNDNIYVNHDIALAGTFTIKGLLEIDNNATMIINGTGDLIVDANGSLTIRSGSRLEVNNNLEFKNNSTALVETGASLYVAGNMTNRNNSDNVTFNGDVRVDGDLNNGNGGVISGTGSLDVGGNINNNGTIGGSTGNDVGSLPVEVIYFRANTENGQVSLQWATSLEENFAYFTIERSENGTDFTPMVDIRGVGESTTMQIYSWVDPQPFAGIAYYRLKATDWDGYVEYHGKVVADLAQAQRTLLPYPNPLVGEHTLNLSFNFSVDPSAHLQLLDVQGRKVWNGAATTQIQLPSSLTEGTYILVFQQGLITIRERLVIR